MTMPLHPTWDEIIVRLILTLVAGGVIGFNREAHGHAAGFRTTILIGLAASLAMIQANILLSVGGKTADSFGVMDFMRLPLGILTGVGFIGGGAILKRGELVTGVTTAATLWLMTVIGLCFGGGQLGLGSVGTILAVLALWLLKQIDLRIPREHRAKLIVTTHSLSLGSADTYALAIPAGYRARLLRQSQSDNDGIVLVFEIRWSCTGDAGPQLALLSAVEQKYAIRAFELVAEADH